MKGTIGSSFENLKIELKKIVYKPSFLKKKMDHTQLDFLIPIILAKNPASYFRWENEKSKKHTIELSKLGLKGIETNVFPKVEDPIVGQVSYHIRNGKHDILLYDWNNYIQFAHQFIK